MRERVIDSSDEKLGFALITLIHNESFQGIKIETQLNKLYAAFLKSKPRNVRPEEHHRTLRALLKNYQSTSGGKHMFNTLELLLQALWQTYTGYEGVAAEKRLYETCCKHHSVEVTFDSTMQHIEDWQNDLESPAISSFTSALTAQPTTSPDDSKKFNLEALVAAVSQQLKKMENLVRSRSKIHNIGRQAARPPSR